MVNIAKEFREGGDYARAELVYRHAMSVAPHLSTAFVNCGSMLKGLNRLEDAEEVWNLSLSDCKVANLNGPQNLSLPKKSSDVKLCKQ